MRLGLLRGFVAFVLAFALALGGAAHAATFTVKGGTAYTLPDDNDMIPGTVVQRNASLHLDGPGFVTFTYFGSDAGYRNQFLVNGTPLFDNKVGTNAPATLRFDMAGLLPIAFRTIVPASGGSVANGASSGYWTSLAFYAGGPSTAFALFNDAARVDKDYDDLFVQMDVRPIPLPAAGWLLVAGIGGLALMRRRQNTV